MIHMKITVNTSSKGILLASLIFILTVSAQSSFAQGDESDMQYRQISMEEYTNKVAGGWLGQAIAVLWGQ